MQIVMEVVINAQHRNKHGGGGRRARLPGKQGESEKDGERERERDALRLLSADRIAYADRRRFTPIARFLPPRANIARTIAPTDKQPPEKRPESRENRWR